MSTSASEPRLLFLVVAAAAAGCDLAPKYVRPHAPEAPSYKEAGAQASIWQPAAPADAAERGRWWKAFGEPELDGFEERLSSGNQGVAAAAAAFLAARALVKEARSQLVPSLAASPAVTRSHISATPFGFSSNASFTEYQLPFDASWQPDFWGAVRDQVAANTFAAQASAADLQNVRLTAQAELAVDYYELRAQDELIVLLSSAAEADRDGLAVSVSLAESGLESEQSVEQARAALAAARAQAGNAGLLRAQYEHAIAVLLGQSPSAFSISTEPFRVPRVSFPVGVPSQLLERRPDVASAERAVAQANAQIGVARAAFFPNITLSADAGFESFAPSTWLSWVARFWAVGASASEPLFDGGLRRAAVTQYRAVYEETVANYRQTALSAFEQVEDDLAAVRISSAAAAAQDVAAQASLRNLRDEWSRYAAGLDPYASVVAAQTAAVAQQQTALAFQLQQVVSAAQLAEALGGGWDAGELPPPKALR